MADEPLIIQADQVRYLNADEAEKHLGLKVLETLDNFSCWARIACPCCAKSTLESLYALYDKVGNIDEEQLDAHAHLDFSLFRGLHDAPSTADGDYERDVELEDVDDHSPGQGHHDHHQQLKVKQFQATKRFRELFYPLIPTGCILYGLTLGGGFLGAFVEAYISDCKQPSGVTFIFPVLAIAVLVWQLNKVTHLLSRTQVEGRPLLTLLKSLEGFDNYYVMTAFACVDTFSRWSRAQFVGYLAHCNEDVEKVFMSVLNAAEADKNYNGVLTEIMEVVGFANLAIGGFILGPIIIQFSYMFWLKKKLDEEMEEMKAKYGKHESMNMMDSIDDLGALMSWAGMVPAGRVLDLATIPTSLDDKHDVHRIWDRMKTQVFVILTRNVPDGILQLNVQAWFLCLTIRGLDFGGKVMMCVNIVGACVGVLGDSIELLTANRRLQVFSALLMLFLLVPGFVRIGMAFICASGVTYPGGSEFSFSCIPGNEIANITWPSGTLPG